MSKDKPIIIEELSDNKDLFGIKEDEFKRILEKNIAANVIVKSVNEANSLNKDYYGGRGDKAIIKVLYESEKNTNEKSFFIKRHCQKQPNEAVHFHNLTKLNAPIPKLYAYYSQLNQQDIIITEVIKPFYVEDDPTFMLDMDILKPFINVTAEFTSLNISEGYKEFLNKDYNFLNDYLKPYDKRIISMFNQIENDPTYKNIKNKISKNMETSLINTLHIVCGKLEQMEKGLYHWDHKPRNMGWSELQQKHVLFDLEDTLMGPRFYNIGMWLGGDDDIEPKYTNREALFKNYLEVYNEGKTNKVSLDCIINESYPIWIAYQIERLLIFFYESGEQPYRILNRDRAIYKREMEEKFINHINLLTSLKV